MLPYVLDLCKIKELNAALFIIRFWMSSLVHVKVVGMVTKVFKRPQVFLKKKNHKSFYRRRFIFLVTKT